MRLKKTKRCSRCKKYLPIKCFGKNRRYKNGLSVYCKKCKVDISTVWVNHNRQKYNETQKPFQKLRNRKNRLKLLKAYGAECECCGNTQIGVLEIDHKNKSGKDHMAEIGNRGRLYYDLKKRDFPRKFKLKSGTVVEIQLLCGNCHNMKTFVGECIHGKVN